MTRNKQTYGFTNLLPFCSIDHGVERMWNWWLCSLFMRFHGDFSCFPEGLMASRTFHSRCPSRELVSGPCVSYLPVAWNGQTIPGSYARDDFCIKLPTELDEMERQDMDQRWSKPSEEVCKEVGRWIMDESPDLKNKQQINIDQLKQVQFLSYWGGKGV